MHGRTVGILLTLTVVSAFAAPVLEGPYVLLITPWTEEARLDVPVLVKEAEFVDFAGADGIVWPAADEVAALDEGGTTRPGLRRSQSVR